MSDQVINALDREIIQHLDRTQTLLIEKESTPEAEPDIDTRADGALALSLCSRLGATSHREFYTLDGASH